MVKQTRCMHGGLQLSNLNPFKSKKVTVVNPLHIAAEEQQKAAQNAIESQCVNSINTQISFYKNYIDNLTTIPQSIQTYITKRTNNGGVAYNNKSQYKEDIINEFNDKKMKLLDYINSHFMEYNEECKTYMPNTFSIWVRFSTAKLIPLYVYNEQGKLIARDINDVLNEYYNDKARYNGGKRKQTQRRNKRKQTQRRNKRTQKRRKN